MSPNGRWVAYVSDESGQDEIYVRPFPDAADRVWQISQNGGIEPVWANSGRELFYKSSANEMIAVQVSTEPDFLPGRQVSLFPTARYRLDPNHTHYGVSGDDQRFVMIRNRLSGASNHLVVVENFFEELRRLAPK